MKKNIKLNINFLIKRKGDLLFIIGGTVLLFISIFLVLRTISFLVTSVNTALDEGNSNLSYEEFNLKGLEQLGVLKPEHRSLLQGETTPSPNITFSPSTSTAPQLTPIATSSTSTSTP